MRATTLKRWSILIVVLSLIGGLAVLIQQFQIKRLAQSVAEQADSAAKEGDFPKAEKLYGEHLKVVPNDTDIQIKYADMLLKALPLLPKRQADALEIYNGILTRNPGRDDVRRLQMELKFAMGREGAESDLNILLSKPENKNDGALLFLMGQSSEISKNDVKAKESYEAAIKCNAPQKIEAYKRLAILLRDPERLNEPKDGDRVIEEMVRSSPDNYRVYLERGRYRRQFGLPDSRADFEKALQLADNEPETYLEMAKTVEQKPGYDEAATILNAGLKKIPAAAALYAALADLKLRAGHTDQAVETLELALKSTANKRDLHWILANILARRGDTDKLLLQIEELKSIGFPTALVQLLTAQYYVNSREFRKARQLLAPLESYTGLRADIKTRISNMLAQCYGELREPGMQQEANNRALIANPQDIMAKQSLIAHMESQGEFEGAIKEYRSLIKRAPQFSLPLARLLITRNRRRPAPQRDWSEVKSLIDDAEQTLPKSVDPLILRADSYLAQDQQAAARAELEKARSRFPKDVLIRCAQANLMTIQKHFDDSRNLLDQTQKELGDRVELRLQRARLTVTKGGPQVVDDLNNLSQNLEPFSKDDRRKLLNGLADELLRLQDLQGASRLLSRLAEQEPNDLELRLKLLDLAFETANSDEIDKNIKQIAQIEGNEGVQSHYCQVRYLIWQAEQTTDKEQQEALRLRTKARVLLNELASRRPNWSVVPILMAQLERQELRQGKLTDRQIQAKEESVIRSYRRAIDLGDRRPAIVRDAVRLLFKNKRGSEALDLLNSIPIESQLTGDLGRQASKYAVDSLDFERAEEIARKIVTANPNDFQERLWLVNILVKTGRQAEAEDEIRQAVALSKSDPDRWITLVQLMVLTNQPEKAARAIQDAEAMLPQPQAPLALAQCCALMGLANQAIDEASTKQWYARAKEWYEKAQAAYPDDLSIARRLTDFFLRTKQMGEVEAQLDAILKRSQSAETVAWARRTLALTLASSTDNQQVRRALSILEQAGQATPGGQGAKAFEDPEELRALAQVLEAQKTIEHRKRAIDILESLVGKNPANVDDRFRLARLDEMSGDWPKALEVYRDLILRTKNSHDLETLKRRPAVLAQFATSLIRNHKTSDDQELTEAQDLIDELKQLQPDQLNPIVLQLELYRARNRIDKAVELIQTSATLPNLMPMGLKNLAMLAEKLDRTDTAEPLYRQYAALPNIQDGKIELAMFLGRCGRVKDALNVCEPLWANSRDVEMVANACVKLVVFSSGPADPVQLDRVTGWLKQAIEQKKDSPSLLAGLGACLELQERYDDAMELYRRITRQGAANGAATSSRNSLIAISYNNLAWLMAFKDGEGKNALDDVNRAITLGGHQPDYLDTRGVIYLSLRQTKDAIIDLENAVKADPKPSKLFHLAQAYFQDNNKEKAKQYLKEAKAKGLDRIRLGPGGLHSLEQPAYQKLLSDLGLS
jgi:cellulose synthase operon protein C